jgi:hypothetical protein
VKERATLPDRHEPIPAIPIAGADAACRALHEAAELNREDPNRRGSLLEFGSAGQLVMTGDMHGHVANFDKLQRYCKLENNRGRFVILHELIHNGDGPENLDLSIDLLVRAAEWKVAFPDNVFFLQSNHELAQLRGQEITKGGRSVIQEFERGVAYRYGARTPEVLKGVRQYLASLPLAARTASGVFLAHSLPDPFQMEGFELGVLEREPTALDLAPGGSAYALVWGRFHRPEDVERFARRLNVELFVIGHTPQETGYTIVGDRLIIVASDHSHGVFLPIDLSRRYTVEQLAAAIRKFVSVE